ncbi:MAG: Isoniazid-inducible protein iniA, partial [Actinomycetota bacterium]|nr:Isoniazid-inducible protein iniA [Actinomycetota bacterium]
EDRLDEGGDPSREWDRFAGWVQQEVTAAAAANVIWADRRARSLAHRVAEHFSDDRDQALPALRADPVADGRAVRPLTLRESERFGVGQQVLTGLRGSYMGMLMFGMLGTFVGMAMLNPISLGAGVVLGVKAVGDEKRKAVTRRRNEAKTAVRRHIDDVMFQVGKDSRDRLRRMQRDLRDHFTEQAEQTTRSLQDAVRAAERSVTASAEEREQRMREIEAELATLEELRRTARALLGRPRGDGESTGSGEGSAVPSPSSAGAG